MLKRLTRRDAGKSLLTSLAVAPAITAATRHPLGFQLYTVRQLIPDHAREALQRLESMITMGGYNLPSKTIREMIVGAIDVVIQAARLRDGSRRITHITEVIGLEDRKSVV